MATPIDQSDENGTAPPLGEPVDFTGAPFPQRIEHRGRHVVIRPLNPDTDAQPLYRASHAPTGDESVWTYLPDGPYINTESFQAALETKAGTSDPMFFTLARPSDGGPSDGGPDDGGPGDGGPDAGEPLGMLSYLSIVPEHGIIEIGHIWFGPQLKRTPAATEAIFLLAKHAFDDLGYRRLEWKCNALNQASRNAAQRFGFSYEGTFANHRVFKGRNRDTAWFAITDARWPKLRAAFETWLQPSNFDDSGRQLTRLSELTAT